MHAVIICNGRPPSRNLILQYTDQADLLIAADGGANIARSLSLEPDVIVGDLDSYVPVNNESAAIVEKPGQETNDLEKALSHALERGVSGVTVFAATGQRLDHTLKNLSVLKRFNARFNEIRFIDSFGELILLPKKYKTRLPAGTDLSLFPLSGRVEGVHTKGLEYPLKNEFLENGVRDGTSNRTVAEDIEIIHEKGDLLLFTATKTDDS